MATWDEFATAAPEIAEAGLQLLERFGLAYLATVRRDGAPRVHPVCPFIAQGRLFVATNPASPKLRELRAGGLYMLHALPGDDEYEFSVRGRATEITDAATRALAIDGAALFGDGTLRITDDEALFEYGIDEAHSAYWENVGQPNTRPVRSRWREA